MQKQQRGMILVTLSEIQAHTKQTYKEEHSLTQLIISLDGESGEAMNILKKIRRAEYNPDFNTANGMSVSDLKKRLALELIDCIYYAAETANELNMDLELIWEIKKDLNAVKYGRKQIVDPLTADYLKLENEAND